MRRLPRAPSIQFSPLRTMALDRRFKVGQAKKEAIDLIQKLPNSATTDDIIRELYFKRQVEAGLEDVAAGRAITTSQLRRRIARWRKSAGR